MATQDRQPSGDGAASDWSPNTIGSRWQMIDDPIGSPDDGTTYLFEADATGGTNLSTFTAFAISGEPTGLTVNCRGRITGVTGHEVKPVIRVGGTVYEGSGTTLTTTWGNLSASWSTNPATGLAWLEEDIEGAGANPLEQFGMRVAAVTSGHQVQVTQVYATVAYDNLITGTGSCTTGGVTCDGTGTHSAILGTGAVTTAAVVTAAAGSHSVHGSSALVQAATTMAATGALEEPISGTGAVAMAAMTGIAFGHLGAYQGFGAVSTSGATTSATGDQVGFSGTAALAKGAVTCEAFGTADTIYFGSFDKSIGSISDSAAGTFTAPVYTATAAAVLGPVTAAATGTHQEFVGAASMVGSIDMAASGSFTNPTYVGTAAIDLFEDFFGPHGMLAAGTFTMPVFSGTAGPAAGGTTVAASGQVDGPNTATAALVTAAASSSALGTTADRVGSAALVLGSTLLTVTATYSDFGGTGAASYNGQVAMSATGAFIGMTGVGAARTAAIVAAGVGQQIYSGVGGTMVPAAIAAAIGVQGHLVGSGSPALATIVAVATGRYHDFGGTGAASHSGLVTCSAAGVHVGMIGQAALAAPAAVGAASGTVSVPVYTGSAAVQAPASIVTATGDFRTAGQAATSLGGVTMAGAVGTFTVPTYTGAAAPEIPRATMSGAGNFTVPVYSGTGSPQVGRADGGVKASAAGVLNPGYLGTAAPALAALLAQASGTVIEAGLFYRLRGSIDSEPLILGTISSR